MVLSSCSDSGEIIRAKSILRVLRSYKRSCRVLDIGCGSGMISVEKALDGCRVVGIDISQEMMQKSKELSSGCKFKHVPEFKIMGGHELEFPRFCFDVVICSEVLQFVKSREMLNRIISEIKRVTKENGIILVTVSNSLSTNDAPDSQTFEKKDFDKWFYSRTEFKIKTTKGSPKCYGFTASNSPEITVIMPNYNQEKYIVEAIKSVTEQTFQDYELIIVDDGSTDNSVTIISSILDEFKLYIHPKNKGATYAWNTAFKKARGRYWIVLSSDDRFFSNTLEVLHRFLEDNEDVVLAYGGLLSIDENGNPRGPFTSLRDFNYDELVNEGNYIGGAVMWKAFELRNAKTSIGEKLLHAGNDEPCVADYGLWLKFADYCDNNNRKMVSVKVPLYQYRTHPNTSRKNIDRKMVQRVEKRVLAKARRRIEKTKKLRLKLAIQGDGV